jgi:hypothetical protein
LAPNAALLAKIAPTITPLLASAGTIELRYLIGLLSIARDAAIKGQGAIR